MALAIALHTLAAVVWIGGMFFAYMALRPAATALLDPSIRLALWSQVFQRFFRWVWVAIALLFATGYWLVFAVFGGMKGIGLHIHLMQGIAFVMTALYAYLFFFPYPRLRAAVDAQDWEVGRRNLDRIRRVIVTNLALGLVTVALGSGGRYFG